jgi:hypothetical protein
VTLDPKVAPAEYNYRTKTEIAAAMGHSVLTEGEEHNLSVFFRLDDDVFHTYSVYARGTESLTASLTQHPTDGSRILRTRPPVGPSNPLTEKSSQSADPWHADVLERYMLHSEKILVWRLTLQCLSLRFRETAGIQGWS